MATRVVVEIGEDGIVVGDPAGEPSGPLVQAIVGVPSSVPLRAEMEPDVHERTDPPPSARRAVHVVQAESDAVAMEKVEHAVVVPARVAELDNVAISPREHLQECLESLQIHRPAGRQLIQDRSEPGTEMDGTLEKSGDRLFGILELLQMGQEPAGLHRVHEPPGCLIAPPGECRGIGQLVEAVVDLNRIERPGIVCEPLGDGELSRVEVAAPVAILPAGTADPDPLAIYPLTIVRYT